MRRGGDQQECKEMTAMATNECGERERIVELVDEIIDGPQQRHRGRERGLLRRREEESVLIRNSHTTQRRSNLNIPSS